MRTGSLYYDYSREQVYVKFDDGAEDRYLHYVETMQALIKRRAMAGD
jgi:hypothetical protein